MTLKVIPTIIFCFNLVEKKQKIPDYKNDAKQN